MKVYIIGVGPGSENYLLPIAKKEIERADCLIGAKRAVSLFKHLDKEKKYLQGDLDKAISYIKKNKDHKRIAVLVSGDPGLYSFLEKIKKNLESDEYTVIPGISSMQVAFAKIGESWQDIKIISLHGCKIGNLIKEARSQRKIFLFTDFKFPPDKIAAYLLKNGIKNRRAVVFENISYPNEKMIDTDLKSLSKMRPALPKKNKPDTLRKGGVKGFGLCVMIIKK